jgi:DNA-binding transcriptional regulator YiaG
LDEVERLRGILVKVLNAERKQVESCGRTRDQDRAHLIASLQIQDLKAESILPAVNEKREVLGLSAIEQLTTETDFKEGLSEAGHKQVPTGVSKAQAVIDLDALKSAYAAFDDEMNASTTTAVGRAEELCADADTLNNVARENLLQLALEQFNEKHCPVCDTPWDPQEFRDLVVGKLTHFAEVTKKREKLREDVAPLATKLSDLRQAWKTVRQLALRLKLAELASDFEVTETTLRAWEEQLESLMPMDATLQVLQSVSTLPTADVSLAAVIEAVGALPEPSVQEAARDYLVIAQEKLITYQESRRSFVQAQQRAKIAEDVFNSYAQTTTAALETIYDQVQDLFAELYAEINKDDEGNFKAELRPEPGKLGLAVDFYGRGKFPPGAYHSEGHQDSMGLCLYLALMSHLLGEKFRFAVLDDVLMSIDQGHRREVCALLKAKFPQTQFVLTTHDRIWLNHMKSYGLVQGKGFAYFRKWTVETGPAEWDDRDVWDEISVALDRDDVNAAAGALRHYLEYFGHEACHRLRASVEFRGDAQFMLNDLLPNAASAFQSALKKAKMAAASWGKKDDEASIQLMEDDFVEARKAAFGDQWQVNPAVHYNEWATFDVKDFKPVAAAFRELVHQMSCPKCEQILGISPERGPKDALRCDCATVNLNLKAK